MRINEIYDNPAAWKWSFRGSEEVVAKFTVGSVLYQFYAEANYRRPTEWEIEFKDSAGKSHEDQYGVTGAGNAGVVMATVLDIMKKFLVEHKDIKILTFSAEEKSRQKLYAHVVRRLLPDWALTKSANGRRFTLTAPPPASINEVFNKPAQWAWTATNDKAATAKFTVGEIPYYLSAESYGKKTKKWAIKFGVSSATTSDQRYGVTGTGNAGTVMATVVAIVKAFLQLYSSQIQQLTFSAAEKSRSDLYAAMIHRLLPKWTVDKSTSAPPRFFGKGKTATYMFTLTAPLLNS